MFEWFKNLFGIDTGISIISKNLKLMSNYEWGMLKLCRGESMGGNAGNYNDFPCVGANFFFDNITGEIIIFDNSQNIPKKIKENKKYKQGIFRVAVADYNKILDLRLENSYFKIVESLFPQGISPEAKINIERSVALYNDKYKIPGIEI